MCAPCRATSPRGLPSACAAPAWTWCRTTSRTRARCAATWPAPARSFGALTPFDQGGLGAELRQARNLAAAALHAGATRLVYSSVGDPDQDRDVSPGAPWGVERLLRRCGPPLTLLRPAFFMENLDEFALRWDIHGELVLRMPLDPRATVQFIALRDVGELIRLALEQPEAFAGPPPELAGDELTLHEALALIGEKLGAATRYERISPDAVRSEHARGMYRWFESYARYEADIDGLRGAVPRAARLPAVAGPGPAGPVEAAGATGGLAGHTPAMALERYRSKRDFQATPEPGPEVGSSPGGNLFVIQKHAARRLHYDVRLEMDGVLKSWAVPKGPSLDPADKHLAVHVEDHPLDYARFEGIIPKGEYGGGTVMVWDIGAWTPDRESADDPEKAYREGKLKFRLEGEKLHGGWMLVRIKGRAGEEDKDNWLLFKERDEQAREVRRRPSRARRP